jgi:oligoendopeptidase F
LHLVTLTKRSDIPKEYTWDLESIYASDEEWERAFQSIQQGIPELEALKGTLAQSGQTLYSLLQKRDALSEQLETLFVYASMRRDEDTTNSKYQGMFDRAMQIAVRFSTATAYIQPEILALPEETLARFLAEMPELKLYKHQLDDITRLRSHVRSAEVEAVLAAAGEVSEGPDSIFSMIDNADLHLPTIQNEKGESVQLTKGNYLVYIRSTDRRVRREAFEGLHGTFL